MFDLVVYNGIVVNSSTIIEPPVYIGIKNEKIACISTEPLEGKESIDAEGGIITPGGIDAHVHINQPYGLPDDRFDSATRSSICGGTTTVVCFACQDMGVEDCIPDLDKYLDLAKDECYCDYGMHMIITSPTKKFLTEQWPRIVSEYGITSVKMYMTYKLWKVNDRQILDILTTGRKLGVTTMIHAENDDVIQFLIDKFRDEGTMQPFYHAASRPFVAEDEASYRAISLANMVDQCLLIVHMSTKAAMDHVRAAQTKNYPIYSETCPQYMFLTSDYLKSHTTCSHCHPIDDSYEIDIDSKDAFQGSKYVCSPPLRDSKSELDAIWDSVANGTVTVYSSDHAPTMYEDKLGKKKGLDDDGSMDFTNIPNGLSGVETRMPLLFCYGVETGRISAQRFVEVACTNPASLYGMSTQKGSIDVGLDADLVIWYPKGKMKPFKLTNSMLHHAMDHTAFEGMTFTNWPRYSILRGRVMWDRDNGGLTDEKVGKYLKRGKSTMTINKSSVPPKYFY